MLDALDLDTLLSVMEDLAADREVSLETRRAACAATWALANRADRAEQRVRELEWAARKVAA